MLLWASTTATPRPNESPIWRRVSPSSRGISSIFSGDRVSMIRAVWSKTCPLVFAVSLTALTIMDAVAVVGLEGKLDSTWFKNLRSEERRVGKEWRFRRWTDDDKEV